MKLPSRPWEIRRTFMSRLLSFTVGGACCAMAASAMAQNWVNFTDQSSSRIVGTPALSTTDPEEKDFAWGDFDHDGDVDLAVARKQPFTTAGRKPNVLFMHEGIADGQAINGVLVDRTAEFASEADDGGQGFLDLTADRDIVATDVNNDGWLDLVTAPTYGAGLPKTISHPRIYMNQGEADGEWQGFKYEEARFPNLGAAPNFCGVGAGDITGDGFVDLYFIDYDSFTPSPFDDRILINDGTGFFTDQSSSRATPAMLESSFGISANIADMNGDGWAEVIKNENGPTKTLYNNGSGNFTAMQNTYSGASYFANVHDLNGDGKLDVVVSDDGTDRYLLNTGNAANGQANFTSLTFPNSGGFGSSSRFSDLNKDGHVDAMICDVDVDAAGCGGQFKMYRNLGNVPNVTMASQGSGGIPGGSLTGSYDVAPIDLNGDTYPDLVLGRCAGISVWINDPPNGLVFNYPQGLPGFIPNKTEYQFEVDVTAIGTGAPVPGTGMIFYSIDGGPYVSTPMELIKGNLYMATFPPVTCTQTIKFYVTAQMDNNVTFTDPVNAPLNVYTVVSALGTEITIDDNIEGDVSGWTIINDPSLTGGGWQQADPVSSINSGSIAAPENDAGAPDLEVQAFITENGVPGGAANAADVDGGPSRLLSPIIDLAGTDATISYARWFYSSAGVTDKLDTHISNDGGNTWHLVHSSAGTGGNWQTVEFKVGDYIAPTAQVRVRFTTGDQPNDSVTEAGIDNFAVEQFLCGETCLADITGNSVVDVDDLLSVINAWGATSAPADVTGNGLVDVDDLLMVINGWGNCS
jgi:hypothetical protein